MNTSGETIEKKIYEFGEKTEKDETVEEEEHSFVYMCSLIWGRKLTWNKTNSENEIQLRRVKAWESVRDAKERHGGGI